MSGRDQGGDEIILKSNGFTITLDDDVMMGMIIEKITGIPTRSFTNDEELFQSRLTLEPMAVFIDVMLSLKLNGIDLIGGLRQKWPYTPLIVMTSLADDAYIGQALAAGANDFMKKPLNPAELNARLRARIVEMQQKSKNQIFSYADFSYDRGSFSLKVGDQKTYLSPYCGKILESLLEGGGMVIPRDELKLRVWGDIKVAQNSVDRRISELRSIFKKLHSRVEIHAIYGSGITLDDPVN